MPPPPEPDPVLLVANGKQVRGSPPRSRGLLLAQTMIELAMEDALDPDFDRRLSKSSNRLGGTTTLSARNVALAAFAQANVTGMEREGRESACAQRTAEVVRTSDVDYRTPLSIVGGESPGAAASPAAAAASSTNASS